MQEIRVLHLSTSKYRGAGSAALQLHNYLSKHCITSYFISKESQNKGALHQKLAQFRKKVIPDKYWEPIVKRNKEEQKYSMHSIYDFRLKLNASDIIKKTPFKPNIIMIHWVCGFINGEVIKDLYKLSHAKIIWTMMDNAPITGGCHYPWNCQGYKQSCGTCPGLKSHDINDLSRVNLQKKKAALKDVDISLMCFSESDYNKAISSSVFKNKRIIKSYLPVDENVFKPSNSLEQLKKKWNIPLAHKIILLGASNVQDVRKGMNHFYEAWETITLENTIILLIGKSDRECIKRIGKNLIYAGSVNEEKLIECYNIADYFLCPSIEDSGPYMINQSLMCGTPVLSFNIGVAVDFVKTGITGYNCGEPSVTSLIEGMRYMSQLTESSHQKMKSECRDIALREFKIERFITSFRNIVEC